MIKTTYFAADYFACVVEQLQKKHNIYLESEIVEAIFDNYNYENIIRKKYERYERYNLFELMILLDKTELQSEYNKKAIIETFVNNNIEIDYEYKTENPQTLQPIIDIYERGIDYKYRTQGNNIKWHIERARYDNYNITIVDKDDMNIMEIHTSDIIKIGDKTYRVYLSLYQYLIYHANDYNEDEYNNMYVILEDIDTGDEIAYKGQDFIDLLENEDTTYITSRLIDYMKSNT